MEGLNFQKIFLISTNSRKIPGVCKRERELVGGGGVGVGARESQNSRMYRAGSYSILDISDVQS